MDENEGIITSGLEATNYEVRFYNLIKKKHFLKRSDEKIDGCAIFFQKDRFELI
jgi:mRNA deadenylase 3'-5' endonuclease subunit Ccr4